MVAYKKQNPKFKLFSKSISQPFEKLKIAMESKEKDSKDSWIFYFIQKSTQAISI